MNNTNHTNPLEAWRCVLEALSILMHMLWLPKASAERDRLISDAESRLTEAILLLSDARQGARDPLRVEVTQQDEEGRRQGFSLEAPMDDPWHFGSTETATPPGLMDALAVGDAVERGSTASVRPTNLSSRWSRMYTNGGEVRLAWVGVPHDGGVQLLHTPEEVEEWARVTDPAQASMEPHPEGWGDLYQGIRYPA